MTRLASASVLLLLGCGTAAPTRPPLQIPAPEAGAIPEAEASASEATVSIVLRGEAIQEAVARELPNPVHRENSGRLVAEATRGELRLEPGHGALLWTLPVELWARASLGPLRFSCGFDGPKPHVDVTLRTEIRIDERWSLSTTTTPGPRQWSRRCLVSFLNIDVTNMIDPHIARAQEQAAREIDEETAKVDLRQGLEQVWPLLFFPVELERDGPAAERLRLLLRPEGLRVSELLTGDASALRLDVGVRGRFLVTSRFPSSPPTPLPAPGEVPAGPFLLHLEVVQPVDSVVAAVSQALQGQVFETGDGEIRVEGVEGRITPQGLAVGVAVGGSLRATLWAVGHPVFRDGALSLQDAAWTPATVDAIGDEDVMLALATGLLAVIDQTRLPIDTAALRARTLQALGAVEMPAGVSVRAELRASAATGAVFGEGETLIVRVPTPGSLTVTVDAATAAGGL